jgi:hypothetical protein
MLPSHSDCDQSTWLFGEAILTKKLEAGDDAYNAIGDHRSC